MPWCTIQRSDLTSEERDLLLSTSQRRAVCRTDLVSERSALVTDALSRLRDVANATIITPTERAASLLFEESMPQFSSFACVDSRTVTTKTGTLYVVAQDEFTPDIQLDNEHIYVQDVGLQEEFVATVLDNIDDSVPLTVSGLELPSFVDDTWEVLGPYDQYGDLVA